MLWQVTKFCQKKRFSAHSHSLPVNIPSIVSSLLPYKVWMEGECIGLYTSLLRSIPTCKARHNCDFVTGNMESELLLLHAFPSMSVFTSSSEL
jgi:hypothetical protein